MKNRFLSLALAVGILLVLTSPLSAAYIGDYSYNREGQYLQSRCNQTINCCPPVQQNCAQSAPSYDQMGCCPSPNCFGTLIFSVDYLYWRICNDGQAAALQQCVKGRTDKLDDKGKYDKGLESYAFTKYDGCEKVRFPSSTSWTSGFKLGVLFQPACSCYDIGVRWTNFQPHHSKSLKSHDDCHLIPFPGWGIEEQVAVEFGRDANINCKKEQIFDFYVPFVADINGDKIHSSWKLDLDLIDVEFGYTISSECSYCFRPHIGLRYASLDQKYRVHTEGEIRAFAKYPPYNCHDDFCASFNSDKNFNSDLSAIGPRGGFESVINLGCRWNLYGNIAISLLYGERSATDREKATRFNVPGCENNVFNTDDFAFKRSSKKCCSSFISDAELGLLWKGSCCYCYRSFDFYAKVGWEHHYFMNQSVVDAAKNSDCFREESTDLSTQGLVLGLGFGF